MSTRTHLAPYAVLNSANMTLTLTGTTILKSLSVVSYDIAWTGSSPVGTITVQLSNSYRQNSDGSVANAGNWTNIPFQNNTGTIVQSIAVSGNSGSAFIDIRVSGAEAIRIVYTPTSGTGSLTVVISGKVT
jgi:hypothetical protein